MIFDEFDTRFENEPLGWLKYFLAPMQDGKFKDGDTMYRIGRAIFVFSGGTVDKFENFVDRCTKEADSRTVKGPDFISRLRGHLDIKGIDVMATESYCTVADTVRGQHDVILANDPPAFDNTSLIRRAILLRSILREKAQSIIDQKTEVAAIQDAVVLALLKTPDYAHGVRSMQAVIEMSSVAPGGTILKSSIPTKKQLAMHVKDVARFIGQLDQAP